MRVCACVCFHKWPKKKAMVKGVYVCMLCLQVTVTTMTSHRYGIQNVSFHEEHQRGTTFFLRLTCT